MPSSHSIEGDVGTRSVEHEGLVDGAETVYLVLSTLDAFDELAVLALDGANVAGGCG